MSTMSQARVLIVDDDELVLSTLQDQLSAKFDVTASKSGAEALEMLSREDFDVIVCDQMMPNMTGDELLAEVYKHWPNVERVLITGYSDLASVGRAVNNGKISYFIKKPWDVRHLLEVVLNCYQRCQNRRQQSAELAEARRQAEQAQIALEEGRRFINDLVGVPRRPGLLIKGVRQHVLKGLHGEALLAEPEH
jgi:DNA-binding NtrC family response regulator